MSQEKLIPINPTTWPTFSQHGRKAHRVGTEKLIRLSTSSVVLSYDSLNRVCFQIKRVRPFSELSRFHEPRKTHTYQSDNLAHFFSTRKAHRVSTEKLICLGTSSVVLSSYPLNIRCFQGTSIKLVIRLGTSSVVLSSYSLNRVCFQIKRVGPFSDNSRFHEPRKTHTYQSDNLAHFFSTRKAHRVSTEKPIRLSTSSVVLSDY
jgi:hypothetical protein